jgi:UDP-glucose 4-epimerase
MSWPRGSVIPLFVNQVRSEKPISVTDPAMTRFMMSLDDAVGLVLFAFEHGENGDIFVQKAPASAVATIARAITELMGVPDHPVNVIGTRHGEKLYETLLTREEMSTAIDMGDYYRIPPDTRDLNYSAYFVKGETKISEAVDYNSHNTFRLNVESTKELLQKLPFIQSVINGVDMPPDE